MQVSVPNSLCALHASTLHVATVKEVGTFRIGKTILFFLVHPWKHSFLNFFIYLFYFILFLFVKTPISPPEVQMSKFDGAAFTWTFYRCICIYKQCSGSFILGIGIMKWKRKNLTVKRETHFPDVTRLKATRHYTIRRIGVLCILAQCNVTRCTP